MQEARAPLLVNVAAAKAEFLRFKCSQDFLFLADHVGVEHLPEWVQKPEHVSDGHLLQLARAYGAQLATLDTKIPGAELIADDPSWPIVARDSASEGVRPYGSARSLTMVRTS